MARPRTLVFSPAGAAKKYPGPLRADHGVTLGSASEWLKAAWVVSFPRPEDANEAEACDERRRPPYPQMEPSGGPGPGGGCSGSDTDNPRQGSETPQMGLQCQQLAELPRCNFPVAGGGRRGSGKSCGHIHR